MNSDLEAEGALAILNCPKNILNKNQEKRSKINSSKLNKTLSLWKTDLLISKKSQRRLFMSRTTVENKNKRHLSPTFRVHTLLRWFSWCFFHLRIDLKTMVWFNKRWCTLFRVKSESVFCSELRHSLFSELQNQLFASEFLLTGPPSFFVCTDSTQHRVTQLGT
jgi:hypothetical protein